MTFTETCAEFDLWYYGTGDDGGYIRKEGRGDARKAFRAARKIASLEALIEGRKRHTDYHRREGTEQRFIKMPGTWLRAECWVDEQPEPSPCRDMGFDERREYSQKQIAEAKAAGTYPKVVK